MGCWKNEILQKSVSYLVWSMDTLSESEEGNKRNGWSYRSHMLRGIYSRSRQGFKIQQCETSYTIRRAKIEKGFQRFRSLSQRWVNIQLGFVFIWVAYNMVASGWGMSIIFSYCPCCSSLFSRKVSCWLSHLIEITTPPIYLYCRYTYAIDVHVWNCITKTPSTWRWWSYM